jgi:periplasmic copper chaperone A
MPVLRHSTLLCLLLVTPCPAVSNAGEGIQVNDAWIREAPPGISVLAGYLSLTSHGTATVTFTGVSSPQFEAGEIHLSHTVNGTAQMVPVPTLEIPAGKTVQLQPGGYHLMLFRPVHEQHRGDRVTLRLHRADGDSIETSAQALRRTGAEQQT